jgi:hypothetical protein
MFKILGADGKEYGPVTTDQLKQWITEGRANGETMVQREGETGWRPLSQYPELSGQPGGPGSSRSSVPPSAPQMGGGYPASQPKIPNYLVQAILVTLCCCLPGGIAAIVYAAQVNSKLSVGDIAGAQDSSNKARMWCWISLGVGLVVNLIVGLVQFFAAMSATGGRGF